MGNARRRGTYEERKAIAIAEGRVKKPHEPRKLSTQATENNAARSK